MGRQVDAFEGLSALNGDLVTVNSWASSEFAEAQAIIFLTSEDFSRISAKQGSGSFLSDSLLSYLQLSDAALPEFIIQDLQFELAEYETLVENLGTTFDFAVLGKVPMFLKISGYLFNTYMSDSKSLFAEMFAKVLTVTASSKLGITPVLFAGNATFEGGFTNLGFNKVGAVHQDGSQVSLTMLVYRVAWNSPDNLIGLTDPQIDFSVDTLDGYSTFITPGEATMTLSKPVTNIVPDNGGTAGGTAAAGSTGEDIVVPSYSGKLGDLLAKYESGTIGSSAIGWDSKGGTSYGKYQIASRPGTYNSFLSWAEANGGAVGKEVAERLRAAGPGNTGSRTGDGPTVWKQLASEGKVQELEYAFIKETHYDKAYRAIKNSSIREMIDNSRAIQEVLWSTAVQHGPGKDGASTLFAEAYTSGMTKEEFVHALFAARGTKFGGSTPDTRASVLSRFKSEEALVQSVLKAEAN